MKKTHTLVLLRHGESEWNRSNLFTGWTDVGLSPKGMEEAHSAGQILKDEGYKFDIAYTSLLRRAIDTLHLALGEMELGWIPVIKHWRLNERHYGALQGFNKAQVAAQEGAEQVKIWRRSYDVPPPPLKDDDERHPAQDARYAQVPPDELPNTECLKDTVDRFLPYWNVEIAPRIVTGARIVIAAHGNSLRALVKYLDAIDDADIVALNIPTGVPLVYRLDDHLRPLEHYYLGDQEAIRSAAAAVAAQATAH